MTEAGIILEPIRHEYSKPSGKKYDSVTRILEAGGAVGDTQWFRQEHRTRGSRVHHLGAQIAHMEHPDSPYEWDQTCEFPEIIPYGIQVQAWCREVGFEVVHSEQPLWDDSLEIAGTEDLIGRLRKRGNIMALVDMKTGRVPPSVGPQTAIYKRMAEPCLGVKIDKRYSLLLRPDRPFQFLECEDSRDLTVFLSMYTSFQWRRLHGLLEKEK